MTMQLTRPRGRRPGKDDTRGTIATSALDLFATQGYDKTSLRAIAQAGRRGPGARPPLLLLQGAPVGHRPPG